jgi:hypothetical protein
MSDNAGVNMHTRRLPGGLYHSVFHHRLDLALKRIRPFLMDNFRWLDSSTAQRLRHLAQVTSCHPRIPTLQFANPAPLGLSQRDCVLKPMGCEGSPSYPGLFNVDSSTAQRLRHFPAYFIAQAIWHLGGYNFSKIPFPTSVSHLCYLSLLLFKIRVFAFSCFPKAALQFGLQSNSSLGNGFNSKVCLCRVKKIAPP